MALRRLGTPRPAFATKFHDCVECQVAIEFRKSSGWSPEGKYPPAKPKGLGFEPLKAAWWAAYAAPAPHSESEHDYRANFGAIDRAIAGAKAAGIPVAWASIPDLRNSAISSRAAYASYCRLQMLNCWRAAHGAPLGANREAIGDEAPQASIRPPAIVDVRRHMSYTMRPRLRGKEAPALAR